LKTVRTEMPWKKGATSVCDPDKPYVVLEQENETILLKRQPDLKKLYLEVTSRCNLECLSCVRKHWTETALQEMDMDLVRQIAAQSKELPHLNRIHLGGFGEPLSHPHIVEIVNIFTDNGLRVSMSTNGTLLYPELSARLIRAGLEHVIVSVDSTEKELFESLRVKGELHQVLQNIDQLQRNKKRLGFHNPRLGLEFVMMRSNAHQVKELPSLAKELGATSVLLTNLLAHSPEMYREVLYEQPGQDRLIKGDVLAPPAWDKQPLMHVFPSRRTWPVVAEDWILWATMTLPRMYWSSERKCSFIDGQAAVIRADGKVSPCYALLRSHPYLLDNRQKHVEAYLVGDIREQPLLDIWTASEYLKFRYTVRNYNFPSCMDCQVNKYCEYALSNDDCWGNSPSCADCLYSQGIVRCP